MNIEPTPTTKSRRRYILGGLLALLFSVTAAGTFVVAHASGDGGKGGTHEATPEVHASATITTTFPPIETPAAQPTDTRPDTPAPVSAVYEANAAALKYFNATEDPAICNQDVPRTQDCLYRKTNEFDSPERGVASFNLSFKEGPGALVVFGRDQSGAWQFWFGTQQGVYHALTLPATMRVCADGQGANVRQSPDVASKSVGLLKDNSIVTAEQFVLTQPGFVQPQATGEGIGWYEIGGSVHGYIRADLLSVTSLPDCSLRDHLVTK